MSKNNILVKNAKQENWSNLEIQKLWDDFDSILHYDEELPTEVLAYDFIILNQRAFLRLNGSDIYVKKPDGSYFPDTPHGGNYYWLENTKTPQEIKDAANQFIKQIGNNLQHTAHSFEKFKQRNLTDEMIVKIIKQLTPKNCKLNNGLLERVGLEGYIDGVRYMAIISNNDHIITFYAPDKEFVAYNQLLNIAYPNQNDFWEFNKSRLNYK